MSALSLGLLVVASYQLVFVPQIPDQCETQARVASVVDLTPKLRLVRGPLDAGESLESARVRHAADIAVLAQREASEKVVVEIATTSGSKTKTIDGRRADPIADALVDLWPKHAPPLLEARALGVPNEAAIVAACAKDAAAAYAASGAAVGRTVPALIAPPANLRAKGLLVDWAIASARASAGDCRRAIGGLDRTVRALEGGALAPVWRRAPISEETAPSSLEVIDDIVVAFEAGTFVALDLLTGAERWRHEVGQSEPKLVPTRRHLVAATDAALVAIDPVRGTIGWRRALRGPAPEIAVRGGHLFVATSQEVLAIDDDSGAIEWRTDPLVTPVGGPVLVGQELAVPIGSAVLMLEPSTGRELRRIEVDDEIAAPLTATPLGALWALVGSDEILQIIPDPPAIALRTSALVGARWPPAVVAEQLVVAATHRRRDVIAYVDPDERDGLAHVFPNALPPIVPLPDYSGVLHRQARPAAVVARDVRGKVIWTARGDVAALSTHGDVVVGAMRDEAIVLDRKKGTRITSIALDERILDVVYEQTGGAALTEGGVVYGLPSGYDPRPAAWLREARLETAACRLALNQRTSARAMAEKVLLRDRDDLDAAAILAESATDTQRIVAGWQTVMSAAPARDPLQAKARAALAKRIGMTAFLRTTPPIRDVAAAGDVLVTKQDETIVARMVATPTTALWTTKRAPNAKKDIVRAGDQLLVSKAGALSPVVDPAVIGASIFAKSGALADGARVLDTDGSNVLVAADTLQIRDAASGAARFERALGEKVLAGVLIDDTAVLVLADAVVVVDATSGEERRRVARPEGPLERPFATNRGIVFAAGDRVKLLDVARGRFTDLLRLSATIEELVVVTPAERPIVWLRHGDTLTTYDVMRRRTTGSVELAPLEKIVRAGHHVAALEKAGHLWVFDGRRGLE